MWGRHYNIACRARRRSLRQSQTAEKLTLTDLIFLRVYTTIENHNMFTLIVSRSIFIISCCSISSTLSQRSGTFRLVSYEIWMYNFVLTKAKWAINYCYLHGWYTIQLCLSSSEENHFSLITFSYIVGSSYIVVNLVSLFTNKEPQINLQTWCIVCSDH